MRYAARVDANQAQIVSALRAAGAYVWIIGLPVDLLVGFNGQTFLVEIKDGPKKALTRLQQDFLEIGLVVACTALMVLMTLYA